MSIILSRQRSSQRWVLSTPALDSPADTKGETQGPETRRRFGEASGTDWSHREVPGTLSFGCVLTRAALQPLPAPAGAKPPWQRVRSSRKESRGGSRASERGGRRSETRPRPWGFGSGPSARQCMGAGGCPWPLRQVPVEAASQHPSSWKARRLVRALPGSLGQWGQW